MVKELTRKCSCCGNNGHDSRTCSGNGTGVVRLFGVDISEKRVEQSMNRSFSLGNVKACDEEHNSNVRNVDRIVPGDESGYLSDGLIHDKKRKDAHEKKKGVQWSEEEHRSFLAGLKSLGRGCWREIATRFVRTRTPAQVASHAQKYYLRNATDDTKKRRSSLFDQPLKEHDVQRKTSRGSNSTVMNRAGISSKEKASISQNLPPEKAVVDQQRTNAASAWLVNRFPHLCWDSSTANLAGGLGGVPNHPAIPWLVGDPPTISMMNFEKQNNSTSTSAGSVNKHPSRIPSPKNNSPDSSISGESEKDGLELKIGQSRTRRSKRTILDSFAKK